MAKRSKAATPDADGVLRTGIYARSTRKLHGQELVDALKAQAEHTPLAEQLPKLRADLETCRNDDNPEVVRDTERAIFWLARIEQQLSKGEATGYVLEAFARWAIQFGAICERINVRPFEALVKAERGRREGISRRRKKQAALSDDQRAVVFTFIRDRIRAGDSQIGACNQAAAHLADGTVPGLGDTRISITGKTLSNRYSGRNKITRE